MAYLSCSNHFTLNKDFISGTFQLYIVHFLIRAYLESQHYILKETIDQLATNSKSFCNLQKILPQMVQKWQSVFNFKFDLVL